jgi:3-deoxy-D-manno-octulosonate 8-phosphate phosphatase (KDO 8-P phosphatase)
VNRLPAALRRKAEPIKLLLLDVDGVLTDGSIVIDGAGREIKRFHVRDGEGLNLLMRSGLRVGLLTGRASHAVTLRAKELGIRMVYQRVEDKGRLYAQIKKRTRLADRDIAYVGDDLADLPVLRRVGLAVTVRDGWKDLKGLVDYVTPSGGGCGAVREVAELILRAQGKWEKLTESYHRG